MKESDSCLFVVHAQHPLEDGVRPGRDFRARLDKAAAVFGEHDGLPLVYVPGSLHKGDQRALSDAGVEYWLAKGLPQEALVGEEWNNYL